MFVLMRIKKGLVISALVAVIGLALVIFNSNADESGVDDQHKTFSKASENKPADENPKKTEPSQSAFNKLVQNNGGSKGLDDAAHDFMKLKRLVICNYNERLLSGITGKSS